MRGIVVLALVLLLGAVARADEPREDAAPVLPPPPPDALAPDGRSEYARRLVERPLVLPARGAATRLGVGVLPRTICDSARGECERPLGATATLSGSYGLAPGLALTATVPFHLSPALVLRRPSVALRYAMRRGPVEVGADVSLTIGSPEIDRATVGFGVPLWLHVGRVALVRTGLSYSVWPGTVRVHQLGVPLGFDVMLGGSVFAGLDTNVFLSRNVFGSVWFSGLRLTLGATVGPGETPRADFLATIGWNPLVVWDAEDRVPDRTWSADFVVRLYRFGRSAGIRP